MTLYFDRPVGAAADMSELEYISALLQTKENFIRADGSLTAKDIHLYLKSRHAIDFPVEDVEKYIIAELAGTAIKHDKTFPETETENTNEIQSIAQGELKVDIVQLTSMLLIPVFREYDKTPLPEEKSTAQSKSSQPMTKSIKVDGIDFFDCKNSSDASDDDASSSNNVKPDISEEGVSEEMKEEIQLEGDDSNDSETNENIDSIHQKRSNNFRMGFIEPNRSKESDKSGERDLDLVEDGERPTDFIDLVLSIILQETKLKHGTRLNPGVIQQILIVFREDWPDEVVHAMIKACGENPKLNRDTLLHALNHDTAAYDLSRHQKLSTYYEDARKAANNPKNDDRLNRFWTAPNVDLTADTYGSMTWTILTLLTFIFFYFGFLSELLFLHTNQFSFGTICDEEYERQGFLCKTLRFHLHLWVLIFTLGLSSSLFSFFTTLGNSVYIYGENPNPNEMIPGTEISERVLPYRGSFVCGVLLLCAGIAVTTVFIPLNFIFGPTEGGGFHIETPLRILSLVLGSLLIVTQIVQLIRAVIPSRYYENYVNGSIMASGTIRAEVRLKKACMYKVNNMVNNAVACYNSDFSSSAICKEGGNSESMIDSARSLVDSLDFYRSAVSDALLRFAMTEDERERVGGVLWVMKKILDGTIYTEEGVWLFPRLVTANILQWVVVVIFLASIPNAVNFIKSFRQITYVDQYFVYVSESEMLVALTTGCFFAMVFAATISMSYISSGYSTVLKYRSGFAPSMKDRSWLAKRNHLYTVCALIPAAFFASIFGGLVVCFLVAFVVIVLSSEEKVVRDYFNPLLATCLGAGVVFLIKVAVFQSARINWYGAFMRRRPAYANVYNTFQDAWNIGLATFSIVSRLVKLVGIFLLYIGRIDTPLLHPSVVLSADILSTAFEKSLLLHEAHRHPYIERIGYMYLLKIGCRENFGTQAGAAWRILFTLVLCPWLGKYRLNDFRRKVMHESDDIKNVENRVLKLEKKLEAARNALKKQMTGFKSGLVRDNDEQDAPAPT